MIRGRGGNFTPSPRGRGRGGPRASPHFPADRRSHDHVGAEPSSSEHVSGDRKNKFSPGSQVAWQRKTISEQAQPVTSESSAGQHSVMSSSKDRTDCEISSQELNNQAEIVGSDKKQYEESDMSPDGHLKSGASREMSWQRNRRPHGQRHTGWKEARPVSFEATFGNAKDVVKVLLMGL